MIVCDVCKNIKSKPVFDVNLTVVKAEEHKGKLRDREIVKIPFHLCDKCISNFNSRLGMFVRSVRDEDAGGNGSEDATNEQEKSS